jgi:hypothetical protein
MPNSADAMTAVTVASLIAEAEEVRRKAMEAVSIRQLLRLSVRRGCLVASGSSAASAEHRESSIGWRR